MSKVKPQMDLCVTTALVRSENVPNHMYTGKSKKMIRRISLDLDFERTPQGFIKEKKPKAQASIKLLATARAKVGAAASISIEDRHSKTKTK
eukprot:scaffold37808_cov93-Skeletonema_marinoi.AAC.3